ncbi:MAG: DUF2203 domain-containing protein [Acidobacteriota bacterium]
MKLFTLEEANKSLPSVVPKLQRIQSLYETLSTMRAPAKAAAEASRFGGGMEGGSGYVRTLYEIGKITTEFNEMGIELKDYARGLIDFPSLRNNRIVYLCWQLGENESIEWWHETDAGFGGRQPL